MEQITVHVKPRAYGKRLVASSIVGLLIGVSAATQAAMPDSFLTALMYGDGSAPAEPPDTPAVFFASAEESSAEALAENDEDDENGGDTEEEDEHQEETADARPPSSIGGMFRNALAVEVQEPVVTIGQAEDAPRPFMFLRDLDAGDTLPSQGGGADADVDLAIGSNPNIPHIKQGEDERAEEERPVTNVFSTSTYGAPAAQPAIPQVVQGNGSSYQNLMVNNIASTIISALQNISATTIVNLNQTCGDYCELNADVDANTDADADQDTDGTSTATTVVNQEGSGQSTTASGSTSGS